MLGKQVQGDIISLAKLSKAKGGLSEVGILTTSVFQLSIRFHITLWQAVCQILDVESGKLQRP